MYDVSVALGYEKIQIWGGSFGSHWGMAVMRYHPAIVTRAVLRGMEGPDHTYDMPGWVLNALKRMAASAEQHPRLKEVVPDGGLIAAFEAVIARVEQEPVVVKVRDPSTTDSVEVTFDARAVRGLAYGYTSRTSSRRGMPAWPADILALYDGNFTRAAWLLVRRAGGGGTRTASFFMLDCGSGISPQRHATLRNDPGAKVVGDLGWWYDTACPPWGADLGDEFRKNFDTEIPTVIVQGNWDTSTPFENALELVPHFKNSRFVVINGGSHGALGEALDASPEFRDALYRFVKTGDMSALPEQVDLPPINWVVPRRSN